MKYFKHDELYILEMLTWQHLGQSNKGMEQKIRSTPLEAIVVTYGRQGLETPKQRFLEALKRE